MDVKRGVQRAAASGPSAAVLRWVTARSPLPRPTRRRFYLRVVKRVGRGATGVFEHPVEPAGPVRFHLDGALRELYWTGEYEVDSLPLFTAYAREARGIVDVGAAEGVYSLFAAAANPAARIVCFEPGAAQLVRLRGNLAANRADLTDRIVVSEVALGDHDGTAALYERRGGTSSLNPEFREQGDPHDVTVGRADAVLPAVLGDTPIDLVKIDTESTEPAVLAGMRDTLATHRPVVFCEVLQGRTEARLQPILDELGYRTWWLSGDGPVRRPAIVGDNAFVNWLFLPDDRAPLTAG